MYVKIVDTHKFVQKCISIYIGEKTHKLQNNKHHTLEVIRDIIYTYKLKDVFQVISSNQVLCNIYFFNYEYYLRDMFFEVIKKQSTSFLYFVQVTLSFKKV